MVIRSMQDQLDDHRKDGFKLVHIDTCLGSFLNDHHNRDGELLLGVIVDGETTIGQVFNDLESEFASIGWDMGETRRGFDYDKAGQAIREARAEHHPMELDRKLFDPSLDIPTEEDRDSGDEPVQAWFLIVWPVPEEEE